MYGGGLVTPGEVETFIGQYKYAALAYYNHQTVTYYDYNSSTNSLIAHIIGKRNKDYGCQRFSSKHVTIPQDISKEAPDRGVIFYRNKERVAVMNGYDVKEFARIFEQVVGEGKKEGEKAKGCKNAPVTIKLDSNATDINIDIQPRPSRLDKELPPLPSSNNSNDKCCLIL
ncbi:hypothetical protein IW140_005850 [Coemansia sp. RSA 1813]|nr:hypothetical protein EV178_002606 [Coemansia sp. RSA 1646]KAJ1767956.1 hypothetical protein LPJ74_005093 [Coemansia sp. RSA 1843]KAJ2086343.1 hypothetical protein IW138_005763 [Coemansia sp. RSA 986]KAJ2210994.1 hypothetical protein EV179_005835 [Coemansia sp. RSA 487]KAJ2564147.1 hypothetical protein IW140_005850 [Coemansia sp. RSA 1813]